MRRFARGDAFDEQRMPGLASAALDFRAASESFAPIRKLTRRDLEILRLVTAHQESPVPTVGGMLLFGQDRERHFRGASRPARARRDRPGRPRRARPASVT